MKVLVTGGGGFLGGAVVRLLHARGVQVRSFTRSAYPWLDELGVEQALGDLADPVAVERAAVGCDLVYHIAAKAGAWGRYQDFYQTNFLGTQNVIAACQKLGITKLVYTSTPSVVHAGGDIEGADESLPYPTSFDAYYTQTKALAEQAVLAANSPSLATVALRPHLIWGPGDPHLIPRILEKARAGKLRRIGTRPVKVDVTYIDNAALAHILAGERLAVGSVCAGRVYFITNGEPVELWAFIDRILALARFPPVTGTVSAWKARLAGRLFEWFYWLLRLPGEPPMTRFVAVQLSTSHWYDISAAQRDLGYTPTVTIEEGLHKLEQYLHAA
jgi:nucleoside-diphosphate-sugar epimerase